MIRACLICLVLAPAAWADSVVAARTIRSQAILSPADVTMVSADLPGAFANPDDVIGMEARVVLYAGRPIRTQDIGPPAIVDRNQLVIVHFRQGPLTIAMEGRALERAGVGDRLRIMNLESRNSVTGTVAADGTIVVLNALP